MKRQRVGKANRISREQLFIFGLAAVIVFSLALILIPIISKSRVDELISFARSDQALDELRSTPSVAIISASTGESRAKTFRASGNSLDDALSRLTKRVKSSPDHAKYTYFRLDVAPFAPTTANDIITNFPELSEHSYFLSADDGPVRLSGELKDSIVDDMLANALLYLSNQVEYDGKFIYGYYLDTGEVIDGYSIPRHAGTVGAMITAYSVSRDERVLPKIELALNYLKHYTGESSNEDLDGSFVGDHDSEKYRLVSSALSAIAYADYASITGSDRYNGELKALVDGINSLRREAAGQNRYESDCLNKFLYNQELYADFSIEPDVENYSRWYDAQATYALVKAANALGDSSLLDKARDNLDDFIEKGDTLQNGSQWLAYAVTSYLSARPDSAEKYYIFAANLAHSLPGSLKKSQHIDPTNFEAAVQIKSVIELADKRHISLELTDSSRSNLSAALAHQLNLATSAHHPHHVALYSDSPSKYAGAFAIANDNGRSRIDDNQHIMSALYGYRSLSR